MAPRPVLGETATVKASYFQNREAAQAAPNAQTKSTIGARSLKLMSGNDEISSIIEVFSSITNTRGDSSMNQEKGEINLWTYRAAAAAAAAIIQSLSRP
jgi:hypothetical protein